MEYDPELPRNFAEAFKKADIRGVYPTEIDEVLTYRVARAFVEWGKFARVIVARDMRASSPALRDAFVAGATASGADVIDIGLIDTPGLYFASGSFEAPGVMITASHNPKEYNGLKLVEAGGVPLTNDFGLDAIQAAITANAFTEATPGSVTERDIIPEYKTYLQKTTHIETLRPLRVVVDAGNGMGAVLAKVTDESLPISVTPLFFTLDGSFPNRGSNPTLAKNQQPILAAIEDHRPDFAVAFDGDADRVAFFDEEGNYINSAVIGAVIADNLLQKHPGETCVYTNFTSRCYEDAITARGGTALRARVGHAFIKRLMREANAIFACEHSAHFYFRSNYFTDSGFITFFEVAEIMGRALAEGKTFSEMIEPFNRYHQTEEVLIKVADKQASIERVREHFTEEPLAEDRFDGLYMAYEDVWFTVKPSVTEDALKFVVESKEQERAEEVRDTIASILHA